MTLILPTVPSRYDPTYERERVRLLEQALGAAITNESGQIRLPGDAYVTGDLDVTGTLSASGAATLPEVKAAGQDVAAPNATATIVTSGLSLGKGTYLVSVWGQGANLGGIACYQITDTSNAAANTVLTTGVTFGVDGATGGLTIAQSSGSTVTFTVRVLRLLDA